MNRSCDMKKMVQVGLLLVLAITINAQSLSLDQAISTARSQNSRVLQYKKRVEQKQVEEKSAFGNYLPSLTLDGSYNHLNDDIMLDFNPIRDAMVGLQLKNSLGFANINSVMTTGQPLSAAQQAAVLQQTKAGLDQAMPASQFLSTVKDQDNFALSVTAVQPLFTGFKISAGYQAAKQKAELAESELVQTENSVIKETVDNYLNTVILTRILKIRQNVLNGMLEHRSDAKKLLDTGLIDKTAYLRAEVAVSDAERNFSDDQNKLDLSLIALKSSMGVDQLAEITITDTLSLVELQESLEAQLIRSRNNQPVFKIIQNNQNLLDDKKLAVQSAYYPTLAAFGKYEIYQDDLSILEPEWAIGLKMSYNLFGGLKDYREIEAVHIQKRELDYIRKETENKIDLFVRKSRIDVNNSHNRYLKLTSAVELAKENLKLNRIKFETGMATSLDVIDAQLQLEKVQIEQYSSLYSYYIAINELNFAQGTPLATLEIWQKRK